MSKNITIYQHPTFTVSAREVAYRGQLPDQQEISNNYINSILNGAADQLEKGKWCQGSIGNNGDAVCLVGSLLNAELGGYNNVYNETQPFRHPITTAAVTKLANHLNKVEALPSPSRWAIDQNFDAVSLWNDIEGRTKAQVVKLLRDTAKEK